MILSDSAAIERNVGAGVWGQTTLDSIFGKAVRDAPNRVAIVDPPNRSSAVGGRPYRLTYREMDRAVDRLAATFAGLGLGPDDIVAVQLPNCTEAVCALLAGLRAGLIVSPLPMMWREHELLSALPHLAPSAIITCARADGEPRAEMIRHVAAELMSVRFVLGFGDELPDGVMALDDIFSAGGERFNPDLMTASLNANDVATVCWAGGGTPSPAPVPRSHNQWIAAGLMVLLEAGIRAGDVVLGPYPPTGLVAIGTFLVPWLLSAGTLVLHHPFDAQALLSQIRNESVGFTALPAALIDALSGDKIFRAAQRDGPLKILGCVWPGPVIPSNAESHGADLPAQLMDIRAFGEMAFTARCRRPNMTPSLIPLGDWHVPQNMPNGPALLSARLKGGAMNNARARTLLGGELIIRSPMMFDRYFPSALVDDEAPELSVDQKGFVATGVRCRLVGTGHPMIECVERDRNVIFHGGIAVSAAELDRLYAGHDRLSDAAAFSFHDPVMGERILAAVVPYPGETITLNDFRDYLDMRKVAAYKVPDRLVLVKVIPRNDKGEVLRDQVLQQV